MDVPIVNVKEKEHGLEVVVHQQDDDSDASTEECKINGYIRTLTVANLTLSEDGAHLGVGRHSSAARASQRPEKNCHFPNMHKN